MREVSGSTWTFQMIILFILIFACFLTLVLSYNKAYTIKNRMLTIIEKYEGVTEESGEIMNTFASQHSYKMKATCPTDGDWWGAIDLDGNYEEAKAKTKYSYCFRKLSGSNNQVYYQIQVFYKFNLPVIGDIATYRINGETRQFTGNPDQLIKN